MLVIKLPFDEQESILEYLVNECSLDIEKVQASIENMKRKEVLDKHPYQISYDEGRKHYYTYIEDSTKKNHRRQVTRKSRKDLEDYIIRVMKENKAVSIEEVFEEYLEIKKEGGLKQATVDRYREVFQRHFTATDNDTRDIKKTSAEWFCDFIESEVARCKLTAKGISNLKGIIRGILKRAKRRKLIDFTFSEVFDDLDVRPTKKYVENDLQVFTQSELPKLINYLVENRDIYNLCILLMIVSGLRVGELVTLRYDDFTSPTSFNVRRTETRYKTDDGYKYVVSESPKTTASNRTVIIPSAYQWIVEELHRLRPFAEYLATNDHGERMTTNAIRSRLYRVCRWLGFDNKKSPHKIRKTYCSALLDGGVDNNFIVSQVGPTTILTTEGHYHFDRKTQQDKQKKVDSIVDFKVS